MRIEQYLEVIHENAHRGKRELKIITWHELVPGIKYLVEISYNMGEMYEATIYRVSEYANEKRKNLYCCFWSVIDAFNYLKTCENMRYFEVISEKEYAKYL